MDNKNINKVDVRNDEQMVELGFRQPEYKYVMSVNSETDKHKLKSLRHMKVSFSGSGTVNSRPIPVFDKLYIYIKGSNKVEIAECWWDNIPNVLARYDKVIKYKWLNKEYQINQVPFWSWK